MKTLEAKPLSWSDSTNGRKYFKAYRRPMTFTGQIATYFLATALMVRLEGEERFAARLITDKLLYWNFTD